MRTRGPAVTADVLERLRDARNRHDLDAFPDCFDSGYRSEQPVHPDRAFTGQEQVRRNWTAVFDGMPDFRAELREAHERDLAVKAAEGVHFEHVRLDPVSGKVFCLSSGPSKEAVHRVYDKAGQGTHRGDLRAGGRGRIAGARWGSRTSSVWARRAIARPAHTHVAHSMQRGREPNSHRPLGQSVALSAPGQDVARPGG